MKFESKYTIGDTVSFNGAEGEVVAVRFTKSKVLYDILEDYYSRVISNVDSVVVNNSTYKELIRDLKTLPQ